MTFLNTPQQVCWGLGHCVHRYLTLSICAIGVQRLHWKQM
jgi:hypothetical protein